MTSRLTADTITDEQIRELRDRAGSLDGDEDFIRAVCKRALTAKRYIAAASKRAARARCAEILNARMGSKP